MKTLSSIVAVTIFATGCANIDSIYRPLALQTPSVAIDVKQRSIISAPNTSTAVVCGEPSPDALSAFGSSAGLAAKLSPEQQAQFALTMAEQAASIGLRTQSIQILRDAMYRACEGYLSGGVDAQKFYNLQRRFQNLMLGLLAIEQLTGVVKAEQASLSNNGSAGTGDSATEEIEALKSSKAEQIAANDTFLKTQLAQKTLSQSVESKRKATEDLKKSATLANAKQEDKDAYSVAQEDLKKMLIALQEKSIETDTAKQALFAANENVKIHQDALTAAQLRVHASSSGSSNFTNSNRTAATISKNVSDAVVKIVNIVLIESSRGEECNGILDEYRKRPDEYQQAGLGRELVAACANVKIADAISTSNIPAEQKNEFFNRQRIPSQAPVPRPN